ncbi:MAG: phenylacetate-CoA oxygenase subunit PaaC [Flavobacteriales bacterium]|nr:phenylacetate-CoA oxygenase subunit PaaC [Flavobacteriales bacterium]
MKDQLYKYLLMLGDNSLIIGHRLSELCGHGPNLETDIALTNHSLDFFGQVRSYFQYAGEIAGEGDEDTIAFLRYEHEYLNVHLVEQPNTDFAHVIVRQFLFDAFHYPLMRALMQSSDKTLAAIGAKGEKEAAYHLRFSSEWVKRLGDGTEESHQRAQDALDHLYRLGHELFEETEVEREMKEAGIGADLESIRTEWKETTDNVLKESTLTIPEGPAAITGGKRGIHTEHMGYILAQIQYMQRAYPDMVW